MRRLARGSWPLCHLPGRSGFHAPLPGRDSEPVADLLTRARDVVLAGVGIVLLSPLFVFVALAVKLGSRGPVFFRQERIGRRFRPFFVYKFRTMVQDADKRGGVITVGHDPRITPVGRI